MPIVAARRVVARVTDELVWAREAAVGERPGDSMGCLDAIEADPAAPPVPGDHHPAVRELRRTPPAAEPGPAGVRTAGTIGVPCEGGRPLGEEAQVWKHGVTA